jgi:hypothetical protein
MCSVESRSFYLSISAVHSAIDTVSATYSLHSVASAAVVTKPVPYAHALIALCVLVCMSAEQAAPDGA